MVREVVCLRYKVGIIQEESAVIGLPLRLVVSLVIGSVALASILAFMVSMGVIAQPLVVSVTPMVGTISGNGSQNVTFLVSVAERSGHAVDAATVILSGLGGAGLGRTDASGRVSVLLAVCLQEGVSEGYLEVRVSAPSHPRWRQDGMVKIIRPEV